MINCFPSSASRTRVRTDSSTFLLDEKATVGRLPRDRAVVSGASTGELEVGKGMAEWCCHHGPSPRPVL